MSEDQFAVVSIKCHNCPLFSDSYLQDFLISNSRTICANDLNIESCSSEEVGTLQREVFICQQFHRSVFCEWLISNPSSIHS